MSFEKIQHLHRDLLIDQIIGQTKGSAQDNQDSPHQGHAFSHNLRQFPPFDISVDDDFDQEDVGCCYRGRLADSKVSAVNPTQYNNGKRKLPGRFSKGPEDFRSSELGSGDFRRNGLLNAKRREQNDQKGAGQDARQKELIDSNFCYNGIDDEREARRKEETQCP